MPFRLRFTLRTMSTRATPAVHLPGAALPATMQAAGVPSARSQSFNPLPRDRADGATLGRPRHEPRRTRRPAFRDATQRGPGAWLSFRREKVPGTAPIASLEARGRRLTPLPSHSWPSTSIHPPRDHADGATLGRLRTGGGSEGRGPGTPCGSSPACENAPLSLRHVSDWFETDGQAGHADQKIGTSVWCGRLARRGRSESEQSMVPPARETRAPHLARVLSPEHRARVRSPGPMSPPTSWASGSAGGSEGRRSGKPERSHVQHVQ